ncbi:MAG: transcriptional regulator [Lachnospiraceae bacterium]|nr:transcriptional regulator [Lachnospiraceae bacterium]
MERSIELQELRKNTGMNRKEFCEYFEVPYSTMTDWELGRRRVPQYLLRLIEYKIKMEKLTKKGENKHIEK